jgi:tetratricopeptide (TPR) repeat protein
MRYEATLLGIDGRLEEAVEAGKALCSRGQEVDLPTAAAAFCRMAVLFPFLYLGEPGGQFPGDELFFGFGQIPYRAFRLAYEGKNAEVVGLIEEHLLARKSDGSLDKTYPFYLDIEWFISAIMVGHVPAVEYLIKRFSGIKMLTTGINYCTCIPMHLGNAFSFLGKYDEARAQYNKALEVTTRMRHRPELALTHLQAAELLLEHFPKERAEAMAHLNAAIPELRDMKMKPFLEKALKLKG